MTTRGSPRRFAVDRSKVDARAILVIETILGYFFHSKSVVLDARSRRGIVRGLPPRHTKTAGTTAFANGSIANRDFEQCYPASWKRLACGSRLFLLNCLTTATEFRDGLVRRLRFQRTAGLSVSLTGLPVHAPRRMTRSLQTPLTAMASATESLSSGPRYPDRLFASPLTAK